MKIYIYILLIMTNSLKLQSKRRKYEYINKVFYLVYVVLAGRDKGKGKDIDDFFFLILSQLLK